MVSDDTTADLKAQCLRDDLLAYRKLETWGASLLLAAILLCGKQLLEWDSPSTSAAPPPGGSAADRVLALESEAFTLPLLMGLVGFILLRTVNFRSHKVSAELEFLSTHHRTRGSWGSLGLIIAAMPLALGVAESWYVMHRDPVRQLLFRRLLVLVGLVVFVALLIHLYGRFLRRDTADALPSSSAPPKQPVQPTGSGVVRSTSALDEPRPEADWQGRERAEEE